VHVWVSEVPLPSQSVPLWNSPGEHVWQAVQDCVSELPLPSHAVPSLYWPGAQLYDAPPLPQSVHMVSEDDVHSADSNWPVEHGVQAWQVTPSLVKVPPEHGVQDVAPGPLICPAGQGWQVPRSSKKPAEQVQV
jgi:hypothetical protein